MDLTHQRMERGRQRFGLVMRDLSPGLRHSRHGSRNRMKLLKVAVLGAM